ncbi:MAG: hypothetical protein Q9215_004408 [Flavoplaca cf. flavocitrina]
MINSQKLIETIGSDSAGMVCSNATRPDRLIRIDSPSASTSDWSFFSYPPEVRNKIYAYLAPLRIHICPPEYVQLTRYMEPWALVAVSSQFRTEIRAIIYPPTPIDLYPLGAVGKVACRTWIEGLHEEMLLRHICIEDFLDIHWLRDGAVHERPDERRIRLRYEYIKGIRKQCKTADDLNE